MLMNVFDNKDGHLRASEKSLGRTEEETHILHFTMCQAVCWALLINISLYPFMKTYMRNFSCISVPGVDGLLLSTCPVYFMDTMTFIDDYVCLVLILAFF